MATIIERSSFGGAMERIERLGLQPLLRELEEILTGFDLDLEQLGNGRSAARIRNVLEERFRVAGGWIKKRGRVDWLKCHTVRDTSVCLGVEIEISGRSDLVVVDVVHLREEFVKGRIDVGVLVTRSSEAVSAVERARAQDLPLIVLAIEHDDPGAALVKLHTCKASPRPTISRRHEADLKALDALANQIAQSWRSKKSAVELIEEQRR